MCEVRNCTHSIGLKKIVAIGPLVDFHFVKIIYLLPTTWHHPDKMLSSSHYWHSEHTRGQVSTAAVWVVVGLAFTTAAFAVVVVVKKSK